MNAWIYVIKAIPKKGRKPKYLAMGHGPVFTDDKYPYPTDFFYTEKAAKKRLSGIKNTQEGSKYKSFELVHYYFNDEGN